MPSSRLPKNTYIEISFRSRSDSPETQTHIFDFFLQLGIAQHEIAFTKVKTQFQWAYYTQSWSKIKKIQSLYFQESVKFAKLRTRVLGPADWLDKWKLHFKRKPLGTKFQIVPAWDKKGRKIKYRNRRPIVIDPGSAFGSGCHETTRLMIEMMESLEGKFTSFFDVGTGTGILAVAAFMLGAKKVVGIDMDAPSIHSAKANYKLNQCKSGSFYSRAVNRYKPTQKFDLVGANLLSERLVENKKVIGQALKKQGYLIISGIAKRHVGEVKKRFKMPGFRCLKVISGRSWGGIIYKKL